MSLPVFFQACGTVRGMNAQVPGPPTATSSPILNVISPAMTQATYVAFMMQVVEAPCAGRQGLLEQDDTVAGLSAKELQVKETTGRRRGVVLAAAGRDDKTFGCGHVGVLCCRVCTRE